MGALNENAMTMLSTTGAIDVTTERTVALYTPPTNKRMIIDSLIVHSNSNDLAGMNDVDFGKGAVTGDLIWLATHDLTDMSVANDQKIIRVDDAEFAIVDGNDSTVANRTFNMIIVAGSTGDYTAHFDVWGYLISS